MGKRALKNQSKVSVSPLISHGQFHRTKTELTTSKKLSKSLSNDTISTDSSLSTYSPISSCPSFTRKRSMSSMLTTIRTQSPSQY